MNPINARRILDTSPIVNFRYEREKLSCFETASRRELALIEENKGKVSIYVEIYPKHLPEAVMEKEYKPTPTNEGRHSNLQYISANLGHSNLVYRMQIQSEDALNKFLHWYQYA